MDETPPPGWYPDPERPGFERYWHGAQWSGEQFRPVETPPSESWAAPGGRDPEETLSRSERRAAERQRKVEARGQAVAEKVHQAGLDNRARRERAVGGEWWAEIKEYRILIGCHYSGAKCKNESGSLHATDRGIEYKAVLGSKVTVPWSAIQDIEVTTQSSKRVTAGRVLAVGVFALAAKKSETYTYIHVSDRNTVWSFATKTSSQGKVIAAMGPVLTRFNARSPTVAPLPSPETPNVPAAGSVIPLGPVAAPVASVADELMKLAALRDAGVLSEEEFASQKARMLGS